ncbi:MAG: class I SAM-dependent methyltransferase, partial [Octadecabacter sp.]
PYPERDPADEAKRLITGSPSDPREIDHFLFGGTRDWSKPLRALFAGGGTGDGLIQLAQMLTIAKRPYNITYIDLSAASRAVAQARAKHRGLTGITFHTGSLMDAADYGPFDYIDCCGVLHHLPDPTAGFTALRAALGDQGGLGFMVYAPYGRSGVYPLQAAFSQLLHGLAPQDRLAAGKAIYDTLPKGHPFKTNPHVVDHEQSDAGFYDLLLHTQDQAFDVPRLLDTLDATDWQLASFSQSGPYDLTRFMAKPPVTDPAAQMALAEKLNGTIKTHTGYAAAKGRTDVAKPTPHLIPHLRGAPPVKIAQAVAAGKALPFKNGGETIRVTLPKTAAPMLAAVNGQRDLGTIAKLAKLDPIAAQSIWAQVDNALTPWGMLLYSDLLKAR